MLQGKVVVVTGAGGALGRAVCAEATKHGARVIGVDRVAGDNADVVKWITVDLTSVSETVAALGKLRHVDGLFHIAGGFAMGTSAWADDTSEWNEMFRLNVDTFRNALAAIVPIMIAQSRGSIVSVGAASALQGRGAMSAYCASKRAVMTITESLSAELRHKGINANSVLPSIIDTPANRASMPDADFSQWVDPVALADTICFLGSDMARAIHGALLPVKGGLD